MTTQGYKRKFTSSLVRMWRGIVVLWAKMKRRRSRLSRNIGKSSADVSRVISGEGLRGRRASRGVGVVELWYDGVIPNWANGITALRSINPSVKEIR